jgi:phage I-like protein
VPLQECESDGKSGWRWGSEGKCYTGPGAKKKAIKQGLAMGEGSLSTGEQVSETIRGAASDVAQVDGKGLSWIEVMPIVENGQNGGQKFTITADDLASAADYIKSKPDRIPVDYDHPDPASGGSTRAAGWFTGNAEIRGSSLWAEVKWTPDAVNEIRDGVFRFISPEWTMQSKDEKSGLWTKFKQMIAATLTNRPYFKDMAAVTARELFDSKQLDALTAKFGEGATRLLLEAGESFNPDKIAALIADDAPSGDNQGVDVELTKLAVSLGLPEDADEAKVLAKVEENKNAAEAAEKREKEVPNSPTDYMRLLGLDETADPKHRIAAALRDKDEKILTLEQERSELKAKLEEADQLKDRVNELEARDRSRDIEVILERSVRDGRVLPAEKDKLAELFAGDVNSLRSLIATRPEGFYSDRFKVRGHGGTNNDRYVDDPEVREYIKSVKSDDPVDSDSAKLHLQALRILRDRGKNEGEYSPDEYVRAVEEARSLVY